MKIAGGMPMNRGIRSDWKFLFLLVGIVITIRLFSSVFMGIMPQDAYYYFYSRHLDLSYFDHPPMIAYLLGFFTALLGKSVFVLKITDTIISACTVIVFYQLAKKFLSKEKAKIAVLLLLSTFMISILSLVSTPDVPLMLSWTASLYFLYGAIFENRRSYWVWSGILTGLSFDSKYTGLFLILGVIAFLIASRAYRRLLFSRWFMLYLFSFAVIISPVVLWNVRNGFASFKFQSEGRVHEGFHFDPANFAGVVGHQSAILLPVLFFSLAYFLFRTIRKYGFRIARIAPDSLFLLSFFLPLFIGFFSISFLYWVKINWMMPAYITGILWVSRYWNKKWLTYQILFSLIFHIALFLEIVFYVVPIRSDDTWFGWADLSQKVESRRSQYPDAFIFSSDDYKTSAVLNFYLNEMVYAKNVVGEHALQFDFIGTDLRTLNGRDALFIDSDPRSDGVQITPRTVPPFFHAYFTEIIPLEPIRVEKNGKVQRVFSVFLCKNYRYVQRQ